MSGPNRNFRYLRHETSVIFSFLGLERELKGNRPEALAHFRWVKDHGDATLAEPAIAISEMDRMERGK